MYMYCLNRGHKPIVFRAAFHLIYFYCNRCRRVYRVDLLKGVIQYISEEEWLGKPLPKGVKACRGEVGA